jgi:hypothetical protein
MTRQAISSIHSPPPSLCFLFLFQATFLICHSFYQTTLTRVYADYLHSRNSPYEVSARFKPCTFLKLSFAFLLSNVSVYFAVAQLHTRQTLDSQPYYRNGSSDCSIFGFTRIVEIKIGSLSQIALPHLNSAFSFHFVIS